MAYKNLKGAGESCTSIKFIKKTLILMSTPIIKGRTVSYNN